MEHIAEFYERHDESIRLTVSDGRVEFLRTRELLRAAFPSGPLRVLDVGGAHGVHAEWLAADGHSVEIVDVLPLHVERARQRGFQAELGDARKIDREDSSYDVVLLLGPLYHLFDREERVAAIREAKRVVRPGGLVGVAAINRVAVAVDYFRQHMLDEHRLEQSRNIVAAGLDATDGPAVLYFHTVDEFDAELVSAGLPAQIYGVEGPAWGLLDRWLDGADPSVTLVVEIARLADSDPATRGASAHLLALAST